MITETLSASRDQRPTATAISDSALKVVFLTTLYVDVKEPALAYNQTTKKLNLDRWTAFANAAAAKRDKIEPICSPKMYVKRTPK